MSEKQLLFSVTAADCRFDYYVGPGNGGQKKQKTKSACRVTHVASGAVGSCHEDRMQARNKKEAFRRMTETPVFKKWMKGEIARQSGAAAEIEMEVERQMQRTKTEVKTEAGIWSEVSDLSTLE